jgi:hypothetical protein
MTNSTADSPMMLIIMNAPGFMQVDKHNHYLSDEELDAVLPSSGSSIVTPPPVSTMSLNIDPSMSIILLPMPSLLLHPH